MRDITHPGKAFVGTRDKELQIREVKENWTVGNPFYMVFAN
jgi:hypothetical protein